MIKKSIGVVIGLLAMIGLAATPALADYPPTPGVLTVSNSTPAPGEPFTLSVSAGGFDGAVNNSAGTIDGQSASLVSARTNVSAAAGNATAHFVPLTSSGEPMGGSISGPTAPVQDDGSWSAQATLNNAGRYEAVVTGTKDGATKSYSTIITVKGGGSNNGGDEHPKTGADNTMLIAVVGMAFVIIGGAVVFTVRRRERI